MAMARAAPEIAALRARQAARARDLEEGKDSDGSEDSGEGSTEPEANEELPGSDDDIEEMVMEDSEAHREDLPVEKKRGRPKGSSNN